MSPAFYNFLSVNKKQYIIYTLLVIFSVGLTSMLYYSTGEIYDRFFGKLNPISACFVISTFGFLCLSYLLSQRWFEIYRKKETAKKIRISGLALVFVSITILIDIKIYFPIDMNISFPESLFFYPSIGFLVEILFHVLPVTILLFFLSSIFKNIDIAKVIWASIFISAALEPIYQVFHMNAYPTWTIIAVWVNLYLFNVTQLIIFKRFDFISMYAFRLIYYLIWHILWGHVRLTLLF